MFLLSFIVNPQLSSSLQGSDRSAGQNPDVKEWWFGWERV